MGPCWDGFLAWGDSKAHSHQQGAGHIEYLPDLSLLGIHLQESSFISSRRRRGMDFPSCEGIKCHLGWLDNPSFQAMGLSALAWTNSPLYSPQTGFSSHISLQELFVVRFWVFFHHRTNIFIVNTAGNTAFLTSEFPGVSLTLSQGTDRL